MVRGLGTVLGTAVLLAAVAPSTAAAPSPSFVLGDLPAAPATGLTVNHDAEPGIGVAPDGVLWATSTEIADPRGGGQDIWRSADGGRSWQWMAAPFRPVPGGPRLGGGDADIAVAGATNAQGHVNVYAASLWAVLNPGGVLLGDISLAVSPDDGATWILHPLAGEFPIDDRPWLTADGACRVDLTYHAGPTVANVVNVYDLCDPAASVVGLTLTPVASTRYADLAVPFVTSQRATYVTAGFGKPVLDPALGPGALAIPAMDCPGLSPAQELARAQAAEPNCPPGTKAEVYVVLGTAGPGVAVPVRWALVPVAPSTNNEDPVWPATAATDAAGTLYVGWHDNHDAFVSTSADGGHTWSTPVRVNPPGTTAVYPTVAASARGHVAVAWYQGNGAGDANDPVAMKGVSWSLQWAASSDGGRSFSSPSVVDPLVHRDALCTRGTACTIPNSRDLLDDFGMVAGPTGLDTIVYSSDQTGGPSNGTGAADVTRWARQAAA